MASYSFHMYRFCVFGKMTDLERVIAAGQKLSSAHPEFIPSLCHVPLGAQVPKQLGQIKIECDKNLSANEVDFGPVYLEAI